MKLYLIRHLPTPWNIEGRLQGTKDISISLPLDESTKEKITELKRTLSKHNFDEIFVSEKKRTIETAEAYGFNKYTTSPLINELNFGPFEGTPKKEAIKLMGDDFLKNPFNTTLGQHYKTLEKNIKAFLHLIRTKQNVLVFGHGSFIRGTKVLIEQGSMVGINTFELKNNELVTLEISDLSTE